MKKLLDIPSDLYEVIIDSRGILKTPNYDFEKVDLPSGEIENYIIENKQDVGRILSSLSRNRRAFDFNSVTVEFGHIYVDEDYSDKHRNSLITGVTTSQFLRQEGYQTTNILFIDNYNAANPDFNLTNYFDFAAKNSAYFDFVIYEADMQELARLIIDHFQSSDICSETEHDIKLKKSKSLMLTKPNKYSCSVLDASFSLFRSTMFNATSLNILESKYKSQQANVRAILAAIKKDLADSLMQLYI